MQPNMEWLLAEAIYEGRMKEAWGSKWETRTKFPKTDKERRAYQHNPNAEIDLALASASELATRFPDIAILMSRFLKQDL